MVDEAIATERLTGALQRHLSVNVARSKAYALSSEPQVGDVLSPEINQTSAVVEELLKKLGGMLTTPEDQAILSRMTQANSAFLKAREDLTVARDGGLTANIEQVYSSRFTPAAQALMEAVTRLGDAQRAKIDASAAHISALSLSARQGLILFGLCALLVGGVLSIWLVRGIIRPIRQAVDTANRVAALDLTERIEGHERDEGGQLLAALGRMQGSLLTMVVRVQVASHSVAEGASEIAVGNLDLSSRTEQQASSLEETAASMEELTSTVKQNADNARQANQLARSASSVAVKGGRVVSRVVDTMDSINDADFTLRMRFSQALVETKSVGPTQSVTSFEGTANAADEFEAYDYDNRRAELRKFHYAVRSKSGPRGMQVTAIFAFASSDLDYLESTHLGGNRAVPSREQPHTAASGGRAERVVDDDDARLAADPAR